MSDAGGGAVSEPEAEADVGAEDEADVGAEAEADAGAEAEVDSLVGDGWCCLRVGVGALLLLGPCLIAT